MVHSLNKVGAATVSVVVIDKDGNPPLRGSGK